MGKYSIKELEQLSGIKAHTIRIWEKRHKIIQPKRTATNIRFYSDDDLKKIINISLLNTNGLKISKIVNLTGSEISQKVVELTEDRTDSQLNIDQLILAMIDLDEERFVKVINNLSRREGFEKVVIGVIYPFLEKIGILWQSGVINPAQEHFISQLIRQKIIVAIDGLHPAPKTAPVVVLFLPENELHELGLLFYQYLAKKAGYQTWYLGQTVPYRDLSYVCDLQKPKLIISSLSNYLAPDQVQVYFDQLCQAFPASTILLSGGGLKKLNLKKSDNLKVFEGAKGLKELL